MDNRDILLVGGGLFIGYLLANEKRSKYLSASNVVSNTQSQTLPPATAGGSVVTNETYQSGETLVDNKIDKCNQDVSLLLQTAKFGTPEAQEAFKKQAFDACMAKA